MFSKMYYFCAKFVLEMRLEIAPGFSNAKKKRLVHLVKMRRKCKKNALLILLNFASIQKTEKNAKKMQTKCKKQ